ncbi:hypothetical protein D3C81_2186920 [compost metagenome]
MAFQQFLQRLCEYYYRRVGSQLYRLRPFLQHGSAEVMQPQRQFTGQRCLQIGDGMHLQVLPVHHLSG